MTIPELAHALAKRLEDVNPDAMPDDWMSYAPQFCEAALLEAGWQPIETAPNLPILVSRPTDRRLMYTPTTVFRDVTGVWRVYRSPGGDTALPFEPTHWMSLPPAPADHQTRAGEPAEEPETR